MFSHLCLLLYTCSITMTSQAAITSSQGGGSKMTVANRRTRRSFVFPHPYGRHHRTSVCQAWTVYSHVNLVVKSVMYECQYMKNSSTLVGASGGGFKYGSLVDAEQQWKVPTKTTDLILHHQELMKVEDTSLMMTSSKHLESLDLSHNEITTLGDFAFQGLVKLTKLDLSFNDMELFKSCTVSHLPRLHTLLLHNNRLLTITPLRGITSPTFHLDMSYNFFKQLEPRDFTSFSKHQTIVINLRHNHLTVPSPDWLLLNASTINHPSRCPDTNVVQANTTTQAEVEQRESGDKLPVHLMWSDGNPWCCSCFILNSFIKKLHAIESGNVCWNSGNCSLLTDDSGSCVRGITLPCFSPKDFNGVNLASGRQIVTAFEKNCCETMGEINDDCVTPGHTRLWTNETRQPACWFVHQWKSNNTRDCKLKMSSWKLTEVVVDNRATLIGIFIVISIPVFLTLLPSCDKEQVDSTEHLLSGAIGVTIAHHKIATTTTTTSVSTPTNTNVSTNPSHSANSDNI